MTDDTREVQPGETCQLCKRRVPHPKKPTSPKTKVWAMRVPVDESDAWDELVEAASKHLGSQGRPHDKFWTLQLAIVFMLQAQESAGALSRLSTFGTTPA